MASNSEMASHGAKGSEIWDSGVVVACTCIWGTFDLLVFNVILESFGAQNCPTIATNIKTAGLGEKLT